MNAADSRARWAAIDQAPARRLADLFADDPDRVSRLGYDVAGIHFDWSKTHLDAGLLDAFSGLAEAMDLAGWREALFSGAIVNPSEGRSATHVAERGSGEAGAVARARAYHQRARSLMDAVEGGAFGDVEAILHIGIGGSALGPDLAIDALGRTSDRIEVRVLSNIDGEAFDQATFGLDPASTLVVAVSKTFTTLETLTNVEAALEWLRDAGVADPYGQLVAITAAPETAVRFGIDETRVLPFDEGVGGRYSLWSAVGFSIAMALGWDAFEEMLEGAAEMDRHFRYAPAERNAPLVAACADLYYCQARQAQTRAVFAYDERLRMLPDYLQQLEMESNGKSVTRDGDPLDRPSAPVTWGGVGTDAQHAVFQLLHQGTVLVPVEFVAVIENEDSMDPRLHHRALLMNCFAQGAALMQGRPGGEGATRYPGDRPSSTILLDRLDPRTLGALIAFYEHRTFAAAILLGINPFDQYGVELGKQMARAIDDPESRGELDASTRDLIERAQI